MSIKTQPLFIFFAGLSGAVAMISYAASAHGDHALLATLAPVLLGHASVLLALAFLSLRNRVSHWGGLLLLIGLVIFAADLIMRDLTGNRLLPFAAPVGGTMLITGWVVTALSAFIPAKSEG